MTTSDVFGEDRDAVRVMRFNRRKSHAAPVIQDLMRIKNAKGWTVAELATVLGCTPAAVYAWVQGTRAPHGLTLRGLRAWIAEVDAEDDSN